MNCFGRRIFFSVSMNTSIFVHFSGDPDSIEICRLAIAKTTFSFTGNPIIEFFFIFFHSFVFLELNDLLCDLIVGACLLGDDFCREKAVIMGEGQVYLKLFSSFFKLLSKNFLSQSLSGLVLRFFRNQEFGIDTRVRCENGRSGFLINLLCYFISLFNNLICVFAFKPVIKLKEPSLYSFESDPKLNISPIFMICPKCLIFQYHCYLLFQFYELGKRLWNYLWNLLFILVT